MGPFNRANRARYTGEDGRNWPVRLLTVDLMTPIIDPVYVCENEVIDRTYRATSDELEPIR